MIAWADKQSAKIAEIEAGNHERSAKIAEIESENHEQRSRAQNAQQENDARLRQTENAFQVQSQQLRTSHAMILRLDGKVSGGTREIRALNDQAQDIAQHLGQVNQVYGRDLDALGEVQQQILQEISSIQRDNVLNSNRVVMMTSELLQIRADIRALMQQVAGMQARM
jgi:chromosome segregation ATPase